MVKDGMLDTLGTAENRSATPLPVVLRAQKGEEPDGILLHFEKPVDAVRVHPKTLGEAVKRMVGSRAWNRIIGTFQAASAYNDSDALAARSAIIKIYGWNDGSGFERMVAPTAPSSPTKEHMDALSEQNSLGVIVADEISKRLRSARLVLWANTERASEKWLEPAVFCPDLKTALFVCGALSYLRVCPYCDKPFLPDRPDQKYCSIRCRETWRKRRARAKAKQGGK